MGKQDVVSKFVSDFQSAQAQLLQDQGSAMYDAVAADIAASAPGGLTEPDVDAAVKAAVDPLQAQIADLSAKDQNDLNNLNDAQAQAKAAQDQLASVQKQLDDITAKEQTEEGLVKSLNDSISSLQGSLDAIKNAVAAVLNPPSPPAAS